MRRIDGVMDQPRNGEVLCSSLSEDGGRDAIVHGQPRQQGRGMPAIRSLVGLNSRVGQRYIDGRTRLNLLGILPGQGLAREERELLTRQSRKRNFFACCGGSP